MYFSIIFIVRFLAFDVTGDKINPLFFKLVSDSFVPSYKLVDSIFSEKTK